nr:hypothetical protein [Tanacetum cinerariifolium]
MVGFVLAYVECPTDIKRPFLPYRGATGTLIFPIGDENDLKRVVLKEHFQDAELLGEDTFVMSFKENIGVSPLDQWKPPSNSAVQLAAVIIASVRIYMYPYISRDDCYYTDTDSVMLSNPLNEEELSPTELGKFKEEAQIKVGYFLAPKKYYDKDKKEDKETLKHKGAAKNYAKKETFEDIYKEPF